MNKFTTLILLCIAAFLAGCSKDNSTNSSNPAKTTGHLYVHVDMTHAFASYNINSSTKIKAYSSLFLLSSPSNPLSNLEDSGFVNKPIRTFDFGELNPDTYKANASAAYFDGSNWFDFSGTPNTTFQISAGRDTTLQMSF